VATPVPASLDVNSRGGALPRFGNQGAGGRRGTGVVSSMSITGSVIEPADRRSEASKLRTAASLGTIDPLLRDVSRDLPFGARLAAEPRSAVEPAPASPAEPGVIGLSPGPSSVAPAADAPALQPAAVEAIEDPILRELDNLLTRLNAEAAAPASSAKAPKNKFFS